MASEVCDPGSAVGEPSTKRGKVSADDFGSTVDDGAGPSSEHGLECNHLTEESSNIEPQPASVSRTTRSQQVFQCLHCPFVTRNPSRIGPHLQNHRLPDDQVIDSSPEEPVPGDDRKPKAHKAAVKCPFCTYWSQSKQSLFQHVEIHFNFGSYLKVKGLEVTYDQEFVKINPIHSQDGRHYKDSNSVSVTREVIRAAELE